MKGSRCYVCNALPQDGCNAIDGEVAECPRPSRRPHVTETEAYWRGLAATELAFAREDRRRRGGSIDSIRIHEAQAEEYDREADRIAKATGSAA